MKVRDFKKLALLGMAAGLVLAAQAAEAQDKSSTKNFLIAAKGCPGLNGCPGKHLTASRDLPKKASDDREIVDTSYTAEMQKANEGNMNYKLMSEDELLLELSPEGIKQYNKLTPEGKELARFVASQMCQNTNACKGLNACATEKNDCAGQGECKGQGKCAISDKNLAVKLVAQKMAGKRAQANTSNTK